MYSTYFDGLAQVSSISISSQQLSAHHFRRNKSWLSGALNVAGKVAGLFPGGSLISTALGIGNDLLGLVGGDESGGGGGGGGMSGTAAVNINLDEVKHEIASIKHETGAIQETLKEHGEQLVDIKVGLICWSVNFPLLSPSPCCRASWRSG